MSTPSDLSDEESGEVVSIETTVPDESEELISSDDDDIK